jgi:hypothetical protein
MRPHSEARLAAAAALVAGPGTCREIAMRTGWSIGAMRTALTNMVAAGDACRLTPVRRAGVRRPVPVYGRACRDGGGVVPARVPDLISVWAGLVPAGVWQGSVRPVGRAM